MAGDGYDQPAWITQQDSPTVSTPQWSAYTPVAPTSPQRMYNDSSQPKNTKKKLKFWKKNKKGDPPKNPPMEEETRVGGTEGTTPNNNVTTNTIQPHDPPAANNPAKSKKKFYKTTGGKTAIGGTFLCCVCVLFVVSLFVVLFVGRSPIRTTLSLLYLFIYCFHPFLGFPDYYDRYTYIL